MSDTGQVRAHLEAKAQALAAQAIYEPETMTEDGWKQLNALFSIFHRQWYAAHHPPPPDPITFGQAPQVTH